MRAHAQPVAVDGEDPVGRSALRQHERHPVVVRAHRFEQAERAVVVVGVSRFVHRLKPVVTTALFDEVEVDEPLAVRQLVHGPEVTTVAGRRLLDDLGRATIRVDFVTDCSG